MGNRMVASTLTDYVGLANIHTRTFLDSLIGGLTTFNKFIGASYEYPGKDCYYHDI